MQSVLVCLVFCVVAISAQFNNGYYTVYFNQTSKSYYIQPGKDTQNGAAWGKYDNNHDVRGWNELWITASSNVPDIIKAGAVGYLEGAFTVNEIWNYWQNIYILGTTMIYPSVEQQQKILAYLEAQQEWTQSMIDSNPSSTYWQHVNFIQLQLQGIYEGYADYAPASQTLSFNEILMLNSFPDSMDIVNVVAPETSFDWFASTTEEVVLRHILMTRCSSLVKPTTKDLFSGHTTWIFFSMLVRIYKHINIPFENLATVAADVGMSSYPGQIASADDFYVLDSGLVVMETSNNIFNQSLYEKCNPNQLLSWHRTTLANRLAATGSDWYTIFSKYNSGTYNNQWIIVDYNAFNMSSQTDVLWIVEQIPGYVEGADLTSVFNEQGYWASYNIPYFKFIFDISGYAAMEKQYGSQFSWSQCPRANIFRRNQTDVVTFEDMKMLMRYNNWEYDELSMGDPANAISSRIDLEPKSGAQPFGGTDSKIANAAMVSELACAAICGPTAVQQPPFSWSNWENSSWPHFGMPTTFDFDWYHMVNDQ